MTLKLTLKKEYFDLIASGEKKEEYREIKPHWFERLIFDHVNLMTEHGFIYNGHLKKVLRLQINKLIETVLESREFEFKKCFTKVEFTNGYGNHRPRITLKLKGFRIGTGKKEWGAKEGIKYFVISLGKELSRSNIES